MWRLMRKIRWYWWEAERGVRKTYWCAWETLIKTKSRGGMGFHDLRIFNQALLERQAWRLIQFLDSLCSRILKAKYYLDGHIIDTVFIGNASPTWRSIEYGLDLLKKGIIWRMGNESSIQIWHDQWIPRETSLVVLGKKRHNWLCWVSKLIDQHTNTWNMQTVNELFHSLDVEEILKLKLPLRGQMALVAWHYEKSGIFLSQKCLQVGLSSATWGEPSIHHITSWKSVSME